MQETGAMSRRTGEPNEKKAREARRRLVIMLSERDADRLEQHPLVRRIGRTTWARWKILDALDEAQTVAI